MKLVIAIIQKDDAVKFTNLLLENKIGATRIGSYGNFLKKGNETYIIGVEEDRFDELIDIMKSTCRKRTDKVILPMPLMLNIGNDIGMEVEVGGATIFVLDVEQFIRI